MLRSQVALAAKGNGPAQRALFRMVEEIERELALTSNPGPANDDAKVEAPPMTIRDQARLIAFALAKAAHEATKEETG